MANSQHIAIKDEKLVELYLTTQDSRYFDLIYDRYARKIYARCISFLKYDNEAEDATQDIFMKILLNLSKFRKASRFSTWVYSITYNYCIDRIRKKKKQDNLTSQTPIENLDVEEEVDDSFILEAEVKRLKIVLEKVPENDKAVLLMKYLDEMSIKEIAETQNKTESAIKMKLKRAKHKYKQIYFELYKD